MRLGDAVSAVVKTASFGLLDADECESCARRRDRLNRLTSPKLTWAVGVTTAPRRRPTLLDCLDSLRDAGWTPTVFAEPFSFLGGVEFPIVQRERQLGVYHNWLDMARSLLRENPDADAFLTVQDDAIVHPQAKAWLDSVGFPASDTGFVSLYTPTHYSHACDVLDESGILLRSTHNWKLGRNRAARIGGSVRPGLCKPPGLHQHPTHCMWGACALAFPRAALERIVSRPEADAWKGMRFKSGSRTPADRAPHEVKNADYFIGRSARDLGLKRYWCVPSLAQHIARHSSCGHGGNTDLRMHARSYDAGTDLFEAFDRNRAVWAIPPELAADLQERLRPGMRTLETGCGDSTGIFRRIVADHTALEHDVRHAVDGATVCPLKDGWYDWEPSGEPYDLILIDGPPGRIGRDGILRVLDRIADDRTTILLDDTHRRAEKRLAGELGRRLDRTLQFVRMKGRGYCVLERKAQKTGQLHDPIIMDA